MKLFFRKMGEGKPLVLLHGFLGSSDNLMPVARYFSKHFEVFIPDLRNHGHSPHHDVLNYDVLTDDLLAFYKAHNINESYLLGHSMGGKLAMNFALNNADLVQKLIVVDIGLKKYEPTQLAFLKFIKDADFEVLTSRSHVEDYLFKHIKEKSVAGLMLKNLEWKNKHELAWRFNAKVLYDNIPHITSAIPNTSDFFDNQTLFIRGENSDYILDEDIFFLKINFPNMQLKTIDKASHWVHADNFYGFVNAVEAFLLN